MAEVSVLNSFGTVVHDAPDNKSVSVVSSFSTVVHDVPANLQAVSVLNSFGTVVHDIPPTLDAVSVTNMFATIIHSGSSPGPSPIITGSFPGTLVEGDYGLQYASKASGQRYRKIAQVPFSLSSKSFLSIRKSSDSDFDES